MLGGERRTEARSLSRAEWIGQVGELSVAWGLPIWVLRHDRRCREAFAGELGGGGEGPMSV